MSSRKISLPSLSTSTWSWPSRSSLSTSTWCSWANSRSTFQRIRAQSKGEGLHQQRLHPLGVAVVSEVAARVVARAGHAAHHQAAPRGRHVLEHRRSFGGST
eukprot:Skav206739  [mRNA]  locus=scaffold2729:113653:114309:- [translate_table: standard]